MTEPGTQAKAGGLRGGETATQPQGDNERATPFRPSDSTRVAVTIRGLSKTYSRKGKKHHEPALKDVDLTVQEGEFLVLLGPSGCGKTTLLRSIAGLERPERGSITIGDVATLDVDKSINVPAERRPTSMIFQSYALWPHMTASRNVAFPLRCQGVGRKEAATRAAKILGDVGIGELVDRYPSEMSGGQQQRLALARALVVGQRVVLFDEPLSNVDAQVREKLRIELLRMQRGIGFTAIYVTHDQEEAMELADRIAVMDAGEIVQLGDPYTMYRRPDNAHVARFLGQSNEFALRVDGYDPETERIWGTSPLGMVDARWSNAREAHSPAVGEEVVAFARPDDLRVDASDSAKAEAPDDRTGLGAVESDERPNAWTCAVEAARFLGSHLELVLRVGDYRLRCWRPVEEAGEWRDGDIARVWVKPQHLHAMREHVSNTREGTGALLEDPPPDEDGGEGRHGT